jgi:hypothetical protein
VDAIEGRPERIGDLCRCLSEADDFRFGMAAAAQACQGIFAFYRVPLALPSRPSDRLQVAVLWADRLEEKNEDYDFDVRNHPLERVIHEGVVPVRTDPLGDHSDTHWARLFQGEGKPEELVLPLASGERRGLLVFASRARGRFSREWPPRGVSAQSGRRADPLPLPEEANPW